MTSVLIDSNVLLDVTDVRSEWRQWSSGRLEELAASATLVINPIIFAEVSTRFDSLALVDAMLSPEIYVREPLPFEAAFLAAKAHREYRRAGGQRLSTLPDFFIGAHALVAGYQLLTRDVGRYRTYFSDVPLISPERV